MGNNQDICHYVDEQAETYPKINPFHKKGKAYGLIINDRLKREDPSGKRYSMIYDLRSGLKNNWVFNYKIIGDEIQGDFVILKSVDQSRETYPLKWSSQSNHYKTIFKGSSSNFISEYASKVELELYADNIHHYKLQNLKIPTKVIVYGYVKFYDQDKIPIVF